MDVDPQIKGIQAGEPIYLDPAPTLGEIAYGGYRESTGGRTFTGAPMPEWMELPQAIQWAWQAAASAVVAHTLLSAEGGAP